MDDVENGAIFDPGGKSMVISARVSDITVIPEGGGRVTIAVVNLKDGIEIIHEDGRLWWPV